MAIITDPRPTVTSRAAAGVLSRVPWRLLAGLAAVALLVARCGPIEEWGDPV